jgi:hypothetical protein
MTLPKWYTDREDTLRDMGYDPVPGIAAVLDKQGKRYVLVLGGALDYAVYEGKGPIYNSNITNHPDTPQWIRDHGQKIYSKEVHNNLFPDTKNLFFRI